MMMKIFPYIATIVLLGVFTVLVVLPSSLSPDLYSGVLIVESTTGQGSCFVVAQQGDWWYAATAAHVIDAFDESSLTVDDEEYEIEVVRVNVDEDVALIRFKSPETYRIYVLSTVEVGEPCTAAGWSRGTFMRYRGFVVALDFNDLIAASGGIVPGCSGGPLLNASGQAIGLTVQFAAYRGWAFDSTALYVPIRYVAALMIGSGVREF